VVVMAITVWPNDDYSDRSVRGRGILLRRAGHGTPPSDLQPLSLELQVSSFLLGTSIVELEVPSSDLREPSLTLRTSSTELK